MPSLPVNCCVESGPRTTSLSICFRSIAYRHALSRGTVGRAGGCECQAGRSRRVRSPPPRKRQLDRRLAPGLAPWLALLLAGAGLCNSLDASLGAMLAAAVATGLAQQPLLALQETSAPEVPTLTTSFSPPNTSSTTLKKKKTTHLLWIPVCFSTHCILSCPFSLFST